MMPVLSRVTRARVGSALLLVLAVCLFIGCSHLEPVPTSMPLATFPTPTPAAAFIALAPTYTAGPPTPTLTSPPVLATPTPAVPSTISPRPLPMPAVYVVQTGDTASRIAVKFNVDLTTLLHVNNLSPDSLIYPGAELLIPLSFGEVHYTVPGDTLLAIAGRYGVSLDELLKANLDVLELSNPDFVPANVLLAIPQAEVATGYDCTPQPPRTQVVTIRVQHGEGLFCLAGKYNLSITTLLQANPHLIGEDAIEDGAALIVPPADGALYTITAADVSYGVRLQHLLQWYGLSQFDEVLDWHGNPVSASLVEGQALFIRGGDLLAGPFQAAALLATQATSVTATAPPAAGATSGSPLPEENGDTAAATPGSQPAGSAAAGLPPTGALRPPNNPWIGAISDFDTGYCGQVVDGHGWTGTLSWPVSSRSIDDERHFRPGHTGIDVNVEVNTPVYAAEAGVVVWNGFSKWGGGIMVVLAHGDSWQSYYAHLSQVTAECGTAVARGDLLGFSGQSGMASWPHLHFEVRRGAFSYDPAAWLP